MKQTIDSLERQELRDLGFFGSMMADEKELLEYLPLDKLDDFESLRGPQDKTWIHIDDFSVEQSISHSFPGEDEEAFDLVDEITKEDISYAKKGYGKSAKFHDDFKKEIVQKLRDAKALVELRNLMAIVSRHDNVVMKLLGFEFCDSFRYLQPYFMAAKVRILKSVRLPARLVLDKNQVLAFTFDELDRHVAQGYCVLILPIRKEVRV